MRKAHTVYIDKHRHRSRSGWSGFGQTTFFGNLMKFIIDVMFKNCVHASCAPITARPLQMSFYSPDKE